MLPIYQISRFSLRYYLNVGGQLRVDGGSFKRQCPSISRTLNNTRNQWMTDRPTWAFIRLCNRRPNGAEFLLKHLLSRWRLKTGDGGIWTIPLWLTQEAQREMEESQRKRGEAQKERAAEKVRIEQRDKTIERASQLDLEMLLQLWGSTHDSLLGAEFYHTLRTY